MELAEIVREHYELGQALAIRGGHSRTALGNQVEGEVLDVSGHEGIVSYEPKELVLRAKAGTRLVTLMAALDAERQVFGFEPPLFSPESTLGGAIATGLSGPRRPWYGAVRDFVLGVGLVTGEGKYLEFGGQVMKNVAGFDVSRLVTGAMGTLGVLADISLKVLPAPEVERTLAIDLDAERALDRMIELSNSSLPVSGLCHLDNVLYIRFSGTERGVSSAIHVCGGDDADEFDWQSCSNLTRFPEAREVWRISVPASEQALVAESSMIDWGGCQRWLIDPGYNPRDKIDSGHATLMVDRDGVGIPRSAPLSPQVARIHRELKKTFDPAGILNPGQFTFTQ